VVLQATREDFCLSSGSWKEFYGDSTIGNVVQNCLQANFGIFVTSGGEPTPLGKATVLVIHYGNGEDYPSIQLARRLGIGCDRYQVLILSAAIRQFEVAEGEKDYARREVTLLTRMAEFNWWQRKDDIHSLSSEQGLAFQQKEAGESCSDAVKRLCSEMSVSLVALAITEDNLRDIVEILGSSLPCPIVLLKQGRRM